jgi:hypothetical protein
LQVLGRLLGRLDHCGRKVRPGLILLSSKDEKDGFSMAFRDQRPKTASFASARNSYALLAQSTAEIRLEAARLDVSRRQTQQAIRNQFLRPSIKRTCLENPLHAFSKL